MQDGIALLTCALDRPPRHATTTSTPCSRLHRAPSQSRRMHSTVSMGAAAHRPLNSSSRDLASRPSLNGRKTPVCQVSPIALEPWYPPSTSHLDQRHCDRTPPPSPPPAHGFTRTPTHAASSTK